jgi:hypothetical protein
MAHYAFIDNDYTVTEVIVGIDESELIEGKDPETWYGEFRNQPCKRTSYNGNIRFNFASVGYSYDAELDAFIPPKPFSSWLLDEITANWIAPIPFPKDGKRYQWNENSQNWLEITGE